MVTEVEEPLGRIGQICEGRRSDARLAEGHDLLVDFLRQPLQVVPVLCVSGMTREAFVD